MSIRNPQANFVVNGSMGTRRDPGIDKLETGLLVMTQMLAAKPTMGVLKIDRALDGALMRKVSAEGFVGRSGTYVSITPAELGFADYPQKQVVLFGLGDYRRFNGQVLCSFYRTLLRLVDENGLRTICLPIMPNRQSERSVSLSGSMAVLQCRVRQQQDQGFCPMLETVEIFCTAQAAPSVHKGLEISGARCLRCSG